MNDANFWKGLYEEQKKLNDSENRRKRAFLECYSSAMAFVFGLGCLTEVIVSYYVQPTKETIWVVALVAIVFAIPWVIAIRKHYRVSKEEDKYFHEIMTTLSEKNWGLD